MYLLFYSLYNYVNLDEIDQVKFFSHWGEEA